jgi:transcription termination/antitermination protein NusG
MRTSIGNQDDDEEPYATDYARGQAVKIVDSPFADFDAVVEYIDYEKRKVRVSVSFFGRPTPVDLNYKQVQKLGH